MSRSGPPPVPPRGVLTEGRRRGRRRRMLALLLMLVPALLGAAAYLALSSDTSSGGGASATPVAARRAPVTPTPAKRPQPAPLVPAEPVPDVSLAGGDTVHVRLRKPPRGGLMFDLTDGEVLWRRRPLRVLPMASLTKIMTAILVTERARPGDRAKITRAALRYQGSGVGVLPRGKRVTVESLLNGLLLVSGNDAAIALADHVSGNERRFVGLMNQRARSLGLDCTHFVSSHGLESGNRSCARDLAVLARVAMERRRIRRIVRRRQASFRFPIKGGRLFLSGHNPLIRADYPGTIGLKTGYTDDAGLCFVGVVRRRGRTLGVVLLHSPNPTLQAEKLLDAGFAGT
jgi:D-alanyl-D-alanine carboxypeptidase (penicillin-binding protein 5/6)